MSRVFGRIFLAAIFLILMVTSGQAASGNQTMKLKDVTLGKIVVVGNLEFVKVGDNKYLALRSACDELDVGESVTFEYTGGPQVFFACAGNTYKIELWGAGGGGSEVASRGGQGGYVSGQIAMTTMQGLYIYLGEKGVYKTSTGGNTLNHLATYNGGGKGQGNGWSQGASGGGASDVRTIGGVWSSEESLVSRIMVASGGGGYSVYGYGSKGGYGGGLVGGNGSRSCGGSGCDRPITIATGGTQIAGGDGISGGIQNGSFGCGGNVGANSGGGGGGWYGGGAGRDLGYYVGSGGGGSSYISGHTGCVGITSLTDTTPKADCDTGTTHHDCSLSPTGYSFTDTVMIDGAGYGWTSERGELVPMPNPADSNSYYGSGVGHAGNGVARITRLI